MTWNKLDDQGNPVRIIDRRQEQDGPSDEDKASNERDRLARRESIKIAIARHQLELERAAMLQAEVRRVNREADTAADCHSGICQPLQEELEGLEERAVLRIASRQPEPSSTKEDARRAEIIRLIEEQNEVLLEATEKAKRLRQPLEGRIQKLQIDAAPLQSLQNQLSNIGIGRPEWIIALHVSRQRVDFGQARASAARKALGICEYNLREITAGRMSGGKKEMQFRVDRWAAEVSAAEAEVQDALKAGHEIYQAMVAE